MKFRFAFVFVTFLLTGSLSGAQVVLQTKQFRIGLNREGRLTELTSLATGVNYLPAGQDAYILSVRSGDKMIAPEAMQWRRRSSELVLTFPMAGSDKGTMTAEATIKIIQNAGYISMELVSLTHADQIGLVCWGPYPTTIGDTVGDVVGVVRNKDFAIGIQALNVKTLGGYPGTEDDVQPSYELGGQSYRGDVAKPTPFGSVLQAYCRNRDKDRVISNWGHGHYLAPAFRDGGVIGSKLAIFGAAAREALEVIGNIEVREHLPHPLLDGVWGKIAKNASESYLIMDFGVDNIKEALGYTREAGLRYLYHGDPFETWGHFKLHPREFPDNWKSLRRCVEIAAAENVRLGLHTLSNFITVNDPYVTPVPDPRLARVGSTRLTAAVDTGDRELPVDDPAYFNQFRNNTLRAVVAGSEIIRYDSVSASAPWKLLGCQRGAFGTHPAVHHAGDSIGKLMDHGYRVFLGNHDLDQEIAGTIARLFNETGLMQLSFDGLEGCWSEGMGDYGKQLFTKRWYDALDDSLKGRVINDASNPGHYFWHIYTRMNWGEPWYAGFRESHLELRLKNQQLFLRNLMPAMLGWFSLKPETTLEDVEWMLARGAGYNAGFGLATSLKALQSHGRRREILGAIKLWETARLNGLFSAEQRARLRDIKHEFHLEPAPGGRVELVPIYNAYFVHEQKVKQPGEPVYSSFRFDDPAREQPLAFVMSMTGKGDADPDVSFDNPSIAVNRQDALVLPVSLKRNQILYCDGQTIKLYNRQWQLLQTFPSIKGLPSLVHGLNEIILDGKYSGENGAAVKMEIRARGDAEAVGFSYF